jgi:hypothetical protein
VHAMVVPKDDEFTGTWARRREWAVASVADFSSHDGSVREGACGLVFDGIVPFHLAACPCLSVGSFQGAGR